MMHEATVYRKIKEVHVRTLYAVTLLQNGLHSYEDTIVKYTNANIFNIAEGYVIAEIGREEALNFESESLKLILPKSITTIIFK